MKTAGVDIGSITAKAAIVEGERILGTKIIFTGYLAKKWPGFLISVFRALNRVSRFSEQIAPPQQTSRFARSKTLFHEVPYKDKEKNALCGM